VELTTQLNNIDTKILINIDQIEKVRKFEDLDNLPINLKNLLIGEIDVTQLKGYGKFIDDIGVVNDLI
jgi:hypothetical protein